jgi:hypothetical protein
VRQRIKCLISRGWQQLYRHHSEIERKPSNSVLRRQKWRVQDCMFITSTMNTQVCYVEGLANTVHSIWELTLEVRSRILSITCLRLANEEPKAKYSQESFDSLPAYGKGPFQPVSITLSPTTPEGQPSRAKTFSEWARRRDASSLAPPVSSTMAYTQFEARMSLYR